MNLQAILLKIKNYATISKSINILNIFLLSALIWLIGLAGARVVEDEILFVPNRMVKFTPKTDNKYDKTLGFEFFNPIIEQNVFDAEVSSPNAKSADHSFHSEIAIKSELSDVLKNLKLTGVLYSKKAGKFCIIKDRISSKEDIFTINDEVFDTQLLITEIAANLNKPQVYLQLDDKKGILEYDDKDLQDLMSSSKNKPSRRKPVKSKYTDNGRDFRVPRGEMEEHLKDFSKILTQARMSPYFKNGKNVGYQFRKIKKGSIFEKLGMRNKDVIKKVNGEELKGSKLMELYSLLRYEKEFTLEVERGGSGITLNYNIY